MTRTVHFRKAAIPVGASIPLAAHASTDAGLGYAFGGALLVIFFVLGVAFSIPSSQRTRPLKSMSSIAIFSSTILFFVLGIHMKTIALGLLSSAAAFAAIAAGYGLGYLVLGRSGKSSGTKAE